ncbi:hypothetical protein JW926_04940, partial [Candidatus Sumerlaeota bacterium]|nr:hypothetical protein [Candidatus Sumerlaeota bacterium]
MPKRKINFRKIYRWLPAIIFMVLVIFLVRRFIATRGYECAAGIYITTGGQSFLEIKPGKFGALHVKDGVFYSSYWYLPNFSPKIAGEGPVSQNAAFRNGKLILTQSVSKKKVYGKEYYKDRLKLTLAPSKTVSGDWDILDACLVVLSGRNVKIISRDFWKELRRRRGFSNSLKYIKSAIIGNEAMYCYLEPSNAPVKSFLHRIDDERIPLLYHSLFRGDYTKDTLFISRDLSRDFPSDPYLDLLLADVESLSNHADRSLELYHEWIKRFGRNLDPLSELVRRIVWRNVSNAQWSKRNQKPGSGYNDIFADDKTLEQRSAMIRDLFQSDDFPYYPLAAPLVPAFENPDYAPLDIMSSIVEIQNYAKASRALSLFHLIQGRFGESLDILASSFTLGQSLLSNGDITSRIMGNAVRSITSSGFEVFILNACETPEDLRIIWNELEKLDNPPLRSSSRHLFEGEYPILFCLMNISGESAHNFKSIFIYTHVSNMKFQLARMAAAAKYHLINTGRFPASYEDFASFFHQGLPEDDFCKEKPLQFKQFSDDEIRIYSIGPDEKDDFAVFAYDPTNGAISPGDIYIRIPREREFPFPKEGVKAKNAYQLLEQFPNGLPSDPFADTNSRPFSIIESTETQPVVIFSFGPNMDEAEFTPYAAPPSKEKEGAFEPVPTPAPPLVASYRRSLQWVMRRSEEIPPPAGCWRLEPM